MMVFSFPPCILSISSLCFLLLSVGIVYIGWYKNRCLSLWKFKKPIFYNVIAVDLISLYFMMVLSSFSPCLSTPHVEKYYEVKSYQKAGYSHSDLWIHVSSYPKTGTMGQLVYNRDVKGSGGS